MWKLVWLDDAIDDLKKLRTFISKDNPDAAKRAAEAILGAANLLLTAPAMGKPIPSLSSYRDFYTRFGAGGYVIRYRVELETIYIIHIRHYRETDFR
jgi:plasmid stabilization system protein ParE